MSPGRSPPAKLQQLIVTNSQGNLVIITGKYDCGFNSVVFSKWCVYLARTRDKEGRRRKSRQSRTNTAMNEKKEVPEMIG